MSTVPEPDPVPSAPAADPAATEHATVERRTQQLRAGLAAAVMLVLLAAGSVAVALNYVFIPVLLVVLAIFTAVDLSATLRRLRRR